MSTVIACTTSKELTRSRAADLIQRSEEFKKPLTTRVSYYADATHSDKKDDWSDVKDKEYIDLLHSKEYEMGQLTSLGLVQLMDSPSKKTEPQLFGVPVTYWTHHTEMALTQKGREVAARNGWDVTATGSGSWVIPIAARQLLEVTGITSGTGPKGSTVADYTWKYVPKDGAVTIWDSEIPTGIQKSVAWFVLYDDGWRLVR